MPTNEEGEFELILGNRQLLSVFFIVVLLLGIFFAMGYIVGQHSTPLVTADATPAKASPKPLVVDSPVPRDTPRESPAPSQPEPASSKPITTAQQQPAEPKTAASAKSQPSKSEPAKSEPPKSNPAKSEPAKSSSEPRPAASGSSGLSGTYLQLAATTKREADIMVDVLRQKKFTALASAIPDKPELFRVLVGPMPENEVNKTKTDLQSAGFPGDKSIKRTF